MSAFVIHNRWALGDTVVMSAMARDLRATYGDKHRLSFAGNFMSFWKNNPYVQPVDPQANAQILHFNYVEGIKQAGTNKQHFLTWFPREFQRCTGVELPLLKPKGEIHLTQAEKKPIVSGRYWVVVAGGKLDMTAKWWYYSRYQAVVDRLLDYGVNCVQTGTRFDRHIHPDLRNCLNLTGVTDDIRHLCGVISHAEGVICGITGPMHIAAMFDKPCVVVAGGREEPWWEAYTNAGQFGPKCEKVKMEHRFLHTLGQLDCCKTKGCWAKRTVPIEQSDLTNAKQRMQLCQMPVRNPEQAVPLCLDMITVDHVVEAVMSYYEDGLLPPIGKVRGKYPSITAPSQPGLTHTVIKSVEEPVALTQARLAAAVAADAEQKPTVTIIDAPQLLVSPAKPSAGATPPMEISQRILQKNNKYVLLDNPIIGGKYTVCILSWGDNQPLLQRCLDSILNSAPLECLDIRVGLNQPSARTLEYVAAFDRGTITKVYHESGERRKYQAMREMLWDQECPVQTKYLIWFDDDAHVIDNRWLLNLTETIIANHRDGSRLYGPKMYHDLMIYAKNGHNPKQWFEQAPWWKNVDLRLNGKHQTASNGSCIDFAAGWFWAISMDAVRQCNIPDVRLNHNGGDITIGAQINQGGFKVKTFNEGKRFIYTPTKVQGGRRGFSEAFPWADETTKANHKVGS